MAPNNESQFEGEIVVASRIVDYLSSGLYETAAACLKELVNNSFDADAKEVHIFVKPDADRIIIEDDGVGMTREEFQRHFGRVSESYKREESDITESGRKKIGKIGIGFIAANEICDVMEVLSTKEGSTELLQVEIDFAAMRQDPSDRRRGEQGEEIKKADYAGRVMGEADPYTQYTKVYLKEIRETMQDILSGARSGGRTAGEESLYGLRPDTVRNKLARKSLTTWTEFDRYSQMRLRLGLAVPVRYHDDWAPKDVRTELSEFQQRVEDLGFTVYLDGTEVRKPVVYSPDKERTLLTTFSFEHENVSAEGYFYAQHGVIRPEEIQGLLLRIRHAAVGKYRDNFLDYSTSHARLMQGWTSGEIWAGDELEDAMNIDRSTFRVSHPAYIELQEEVHERLHAFLDRVRDKIYGAGTEERKTRKARNKAKSISDFADNKLAPVSESAATRLKQSWEGAEQEGDRRDKLLAEYSVGELYELVVSVAKEILPPSKVEEFVEKLTERLQQ